MDSEPIVADNPQRHRFEVRLGGELAGFADYRSGPEAVTFTHTEVDPRFRGRGVAATLVGAALDRVRADGRRVVPLCSYVSHYISHHPQYADLVAHGPSDAGGA